MSRAVPLPAGFRLVLDGRVRRLRCGRVLAGAAGTRLVRLSPAGDEALEGLLAGRPGSPAARLLGRRLIDAGLAHPRPPAPGRPPDVTIVVPVRDRPAALGALLTTLGRRHAVIVVDDGSADPAAVEALCAAHGARVLRRPVSGGPAAARNAALPLARTELIAFVDSDCLPAPGWIGRLASHFDDPTLGAVAPRIRSRAGGGAPLARYAQARSPLDLGSHEAAVGPGRAVAYVPTAALLVRRAALGDGFDPALRYGEDVDLVWRLHDAGWGIRYDPAVTVDHAEPVGWRPLLARRLRYGTSAAPLAQRHPGRLAPVVLRPWPQAVVMAVLLRRPRVAAVLAGAGAARVVRRTRGAGARPWDAVRWSAAGVLSSAVAVGRAATMFGGPALLVASVRHRGARGPVVALLAVSPLVEWLTRRPPLDPVRWTLASVADDAAYGLGVGLGCLRERTVAPLRPARSGRRGGAHGRGAA